MISRCSHAATDMRSVARRQSVVASVPQKIAISHFVAAGTRALRVGNQRFANRSFLTEKWDDRKMLAGRFTPQMSPFFCHAIFLSAHPPLNLRDSTEFICVRQRRFVMIPTRAARLKTSQITAGIQVATLPGNRYDPRSAGYEADYRLPEGGAAASIDCHCSVFRDELASAS